MKKGDEVFEGDELINEALNVEFDDMDTYVGGIMSIWKCDGDRWSYFEILDDVKEMGYPGVLEMWYDFAGTLKELVNDFGAIEMLNWCKNNEKIPDIDTLPEIPEQNEKTIKSDLNEQRDDNALGCRFDDSDDEVLNDGIYEVLIGV
ncbi:hypothetical protein KIW84_013630 [Lathyrus oleraceus]|uniref:PB1-like domain-containing protein n=1 Tax=Pisum sativum TaxID=3888 RepID=A0A9D5BKM1_PEA|nr:hypothetical protein KIW84_013630 [Pisum sativum]